MMESKARDSETEHPEERRKERTDQTEKDKHMNRQNRW